MNSAIKALEEIGQNTSLKQHDSLMEMLQSLNVNTDDMDKVNTIKRELVCGMIPEDDSDDGDKEEE